MWVTKLPFLENGNDDVWFFAPKFLGNRTIITVDAKILSENVHIVYEKLRKLEKNEENLRLYRE